MPWLEDLLSLQLSSGPWRMRPFGSLKAEMACEVAEMKKQTQVAGQNREKENKDGLDVT